MPAGSGHPAYGFKFVEYGRVESRRKTAIVVAYYSIYGELGPLRDRSIGKPSLSLVKGSLAIHLIIEEDWSFYGSDLSALVIMLLNASQDSGVREVSGLLGPLGEKEEDFDVRGAFTVTFQGSQR
ncbi:hypothetical protein ACLMJK_001474 [Lecanora helva]